MAKPGQNPMGNEMPATELHSLDQTQPLDDEVQVNVEQILEEFEGESPIRKLQGACYF